MTTMLWTLEATARALERKGKRTTANWYVTLHSRSTASAPARSHPQFCSASHHAKRCWTWSTGCPELWDARRLTVHSLSSVLAKGAPCSLAQRCAASSLCVTMHYGIQ